MAIRACLVLSICCLPLIIAQSCTKKENKELKAKCMDPYSKSTEVCNGRGICNCGLCECNYRRSNSAERYSGEFCNCDDYSCGIHDRMMCGGPTRGQCSCGYCNCNEGYKGLACECPTGNATCIDPNGKLCNGIGICNCGKCKCQKPYRGDYCTECPDCTGSCESYKECVLCRVFKSGSYGNAECASKCSNIPLAVVDQLEAESAIYKLCSYKREEDDCDIRFSYAPDSSKVSVLKTAVCTKKSSSASKSITSNVVISTITTLIPLVMSLMYL